MSPRTLGARQARRAQLRRRRRRQGLVAFFAATAIVTTLIVGSAWLGKRVLAPSDGQPQATPTAVALGEQDTMLLVRHGKDDQGPALGVTLLATQPDGGGMVMFLPVGTLVDIPGFGLDQLGLSFQYGGAALLEASVENMLGIDVDHVASASQSGLAALLGRTGGLEVELEDRLVARAPNGSADVRFEPGVQFLDGERLVEYWGFRQRGEQELATFPRQQLVWQRLLGAASDPKVIEAMVGDGAPQLNTTANPRFLRTMLRSLARARSEDRVSFSLLPVTPFGSDGGTDDTYRPRPDGIRDLAEGALAPSVPTGGGADAIRVQVLNGVGTPGIGQQVDRRLEGSGFRIVLTDNARSFDFTETRILVYREDRRSLDAAEQVRQRLGVGTIQVSRQPQSVVDLTIVVGADFQPERPEPSGEPSEEQST